MRYITATLYVATIVAANVLTAHLGTVPIGFGLTVTVGTFAAGVALAARNFTQDAAGRVVVLALMALGVAISYALATPQLALASGAAFALSELSDMAVYTPLRDRGRNRAQLAACTVGAILDTIVFLWLAGFPITTGLVTGQVLVKLASVAVVLALIGGARRAVLREPRHA